MMDSITILSLVAVLCCMLPAQIAAVKNSLCDAKPLHDDRQPDVVEAPLTRWGTPPVIVQRIKQGYSPLAGTQVWCFENGEVVITKILYADYIMKWSKESDEVKIHKFLNGNITQEWNFGDSVHIKLAKSKKFEKQTWEMENTKMHYIRNRKSGSTTLQWENNVEDFESLQKYQEFISSWCAENGSWVKARCNIYTVVRKEHNGPYLSNGIKYT